MGKIKYSIFGLIFGLYYEDTLSTSERRSRRKFIREKYKKLKPAILVIKWPLDIYIISIIVTSILASTRVIQIQYIFLTEVSLVINGIFIGAWGIIYSFNILFECAQTTWDLMVFRAHLHFWMSFGLMLFCINQIISWF